MLIAGLVAVQEVAVVQALLEQVALLVLTVHSMAQVVHPVLRAQAVTQAVQAHLVLTAQAERLVQVVQPEVPVQVGMVLLVHLAVREVLEKQGVREQVVRLELQVRQGLVELQVVVVVQVILEVVEQAARQGVVAHQD